MSQLPPLSILPDKPDLDETFESTASSGTEGTDDTSVDLREFILFAEKWNVSGGDSIATFDEFSGEDQYLNKDEFSDAMDTVYKRGVTSLLYQLIGEGFPDQDAFSSGYLATTGTFNIESSYLQPGAEEWSDFFGSDDSGDDDDDPWKGW